MADDSESRVRRYYAALNALDLGAVESMFAIDASYHSAGIGTLLGRPAIRAAMRAYFDEYPDQVAAFDALVSGCGNTVRTTWRLKATSRTTGQVHERRGNETIIFGGDGQIERIEVEDL